jgi:predicted phosphate transport protein (TIGR00153 family)
VNIIGKLVPRENRFFELFNQHASLAAEAGGVLSGLLRDYATENAAERTARIERINDLEHNADRITHETVALIQTIFVTPLDRDDIHRLISRMDDILDLMQDTAESLQLYDVQHVTEPAVELAELLETCCVRLQSAVALLNNMRNAPEALKLCREIDNMESQADRVMRGAISKLFRDEPDLRQVIKLKAIYELLEAATDRCQDVANLIENITLQNA